MMDIPPVMKEPKGNTLSPVLQKKSLSWSFGNGGVKVRYLARRGGQNEA